ncbi:MAG: methyltransferase [Betaproteobacteria bacterium RBG_16_66_20]|nr:MAG: methyltransferase [Betaproteobacteria bacterium RBG_16_66_20]
MAELGWLIQPAVFPWAALAAGLCIGSFLNVVIHRLPKMMERAWRADCAELAGQPPPKEQPYNLVVPRSSCPGCGRRIAAIENVPIASWLALRGKCAGCGARISLRYPMVELLAGCGAAWSAWHFGFSAAAFGGMLFIWCTIALAFIDHATGYLPDDITLPLLWAGLLLNAFGTFVPLSDAVIGAAGGYLSLWLIYWAYRLATGKEGMGFGDFKMNAAIGAFFGWKLLPLVILVSSVVGLAFGVMQMIAARRGWDAAFRFHFGPYLAIAAIVAMFWGDRILHWYLAR